MKQLKAKLYEFEMQKKNADKQVLEDNKSDIGWGSQIRSYVLDDSVLKICVPVWKHVTRKPY